MFGSTSVAEHLNKISGRAKKIETLNSALQMEKQQLSLEISSLNKTLEEQERIMKNYFETIRQEITKLDLSSFDNQKPIAPEQQKPQEKKTKNKRLGKTRTKTRRILSQM